MKVPYVYEGIEVTIEFYEALCVESTPSPESKICKSILKGLTMLFACRDRPIGSYGSGTVNNGSL